MRKIKFRAIFNNKEYEVVSINFYTGDIELFADGIPTENYYIKKNYSLRIKIIKSNFKYNNIKIMQYTGENDGNGEEVYTVPKIINNE